MERTASHMPAGGRAGFTLTELLVAMAIFLILMSGLATMFDAAVSSARQGYASIDAYENARNAISTIDRDLSGAFVSEEFGDLYNFYGRPDGFMFVGTLEGGDVGRVTYAFHPEADKLGFETTIGMQWNVARQNIARQFQRIAWENGIVGPAADTLINDALVQFDTAYPQPPDTPSTPGEERVIDINVRMETESLIRYEEPGLSDLDTFDMTVDGATNLDWRFAYVDPIEPSDDAAPTSGDPGFGQYNFLKGALDATPTNASADGSDVRDLFFNINVASGGWDVGGEDLYLRVLNRNTFDTLLQARKREFWIRMLSGDNMGVDELDFAALGTIPGYPDHDYDAANNVWGYWYDESLGTVNPLGRRTVNEFIVADGIIARAVPRANGADLSIAVGGEIRELDVLDAAPRFAYGDARNGTSHYFNAAENLADPFNLDGIYDFDDDGVVDPGEEYPNVPTLVHGGAYSNYPDRETMLLSADTDLAENQLSNNRVSLQNMGSPFLPRLPAAVVPQLWVTRSATRPGAPGFRRRFVQSIPVPTASGRTPSTVIAQSPGQSM